MSDRRGDNTGVLLREGDLLRATYDTIELYVRLLAGGNAQVADRYGRVLDKSVYSIHEANEYARYNYELVGNDLEVHIDLDFDDYEAVREAFDVMYTLPSRVFVVHPTGDVSGCLTQILRRPWAAHYGGVYSEGLVHYSNLCGYRRFTGCNHPDTNGVCPDFPCPIVEQAGEWLVRVVGRPKGTYNEWYSNVFIQYKDGSMDIPRPGIMGLDEQFTPLVEFELRRRVEQGANSLMLTFDQSDIFTGSLVTGETVALLSQILVERVMLDDDGEPVEVDGVIQTEIVREPIVMLEMRDQPYVPCPISHDAPVFTIEKVKLRRYVPRLVVTYPTLFLIRTAAGDIIDYHDPNAAEIIKRALIKEAETSAEECLRLVERQIAERAV
jgi:hypothetical protein